MACPSHLSLTARERGRRRAGKGPSLPVKTGWWRRWGAASSATTTEQTGRPRGASHPRLIKYNGLCKSLFSLSCSNLHLAVDDRAPFMLCQNVWVLQFLVPRLCPRTGKKMLCSITASKESSRSHDHFHTTLLFPALFFFPHYYQNVKKAYYSYCQGNYLLFQIQRGVWHNFHDHSCCCLKKNETQCLVCHPPLPHRTDSIINGPASSYYFTSFYIYHAGAPAKPQGCHILNNVAFLYPTPQTLALDSGRDTHGHTHSKEGNGHCQENRSQRKWLRDERQQGQSQDTLGKRKKWACVFTFVCRQKSA